MFLPGNPLPLLIPVYPPPCESQKTLSCFARGRRAQLSEDKEAAASKLCLLVQSPGRGVYCFEADLHQWHDLQLFF